MIPSSRETKFPTKEDKNKARASSNATPWLKSKDPRIVRASRSFGGKDRHSKVCTIRGLRDRRVRLSVPTAIQLYDLQDRLGLNQPSKVVDWLLDVAKDDIDKLPPLQIPQGSFINWEDFSNPCPKSKEVDTNDEDEEDQERVDTDINGTSYGAQVSSSNNIFPRNNQSSLQDFFSTSTSTNISTGTSAMPQGPYYQLDPSNFKFSQQTNQHQHHYQHQEQQNSNVFPFQSTLSLPSRATHVLVYPQGATQAYFPSYSPSTSAEFDHSRQNNHFHMLSSSTSSSSQNLMSSSLSPPSSTLSQSIRHFQLSMTPMHIDARNNEDG